MINDILRKTIAAVVAARKDKHGWAKGLFKDIHLVAPAHRGEIGERLLERLLIDAGVSGVTRAGKIDRTKKHWDIKTEDMTIEVKTATLGRNSNTFQHESIEKDRDYDALVLIDIAPDDVFITWFAKRDIPWKSEGKGIHRRAKGSDYKLTLNLSRIAHCRVKTLNDIAGAYQKLLLEISR